jgi:membrane peptidoglycan carboxypeptidase
MSTSIPHIIRRRKNRKQRRQAAHAKNRLWGGLIGGILALTVVLPIVTILGLAGFLYVRAVQWLPTAATTIYQDPIIGNTNLYDRTGTTLLFSVRDPLGDERTWTALETLPTYVAQATLQMEDPNFLDVTTWDISTTIGKLWSYILGTIPANDNTLTGRFVRNTLIPLAQNKGLDNALLQIAFVSEINRRYTPRAILEWYLNTAYYGHDAYGIEAAAQVYLGKSATELTLDETTLLAAIPLEPRYNPFDNEAAARGRQADLLRAMLVNDRISQSDFDTAASRFTPLNATLLQQPLVAPQFSLYARDQVQDILDGMGLDGARLVSRGGLQITTTLDLDLYYQSECLLRAHLAQLNGQSPNSVVSLRGEACTSLPYLSAPFGVDNTRLPNEGAILMLDVTTGEIGAMVGDVTAYTYQPSVTLQPFVYFEGFRSSEFTPASMVFDIPQPFPGSDDGLIYQPANPDGVYRGPINLRAAMASGLLPPAVSVADSRSINRVLNSAHIIGINSLSEGVYDLSLLERGGQVSVLDVAYAYSVFASMGYMQGVDVEPIAPNFRARNPIAILKITDAQGQVLWEYDASKQALLRTNIMGASFSYLVNNILADDNSRRQTLGVDTGVLNVARPSAIVNGMSSDKVDNWAVGYTPQWVTAVHLGRNDDAPMSLKPLALEGSAVLWNALMRYIHDRNALPIADWQQPPDVAQYSVCERSGMIPRPEVNCPRYNESFLRQVPPYQTDNFWQSITINSETRQRATAFTPVNLQIQSIYFVPPDIAMDWWQSNGLPLPPNEYDTQSRPDILKAVELFVPSDFAYVGGQVDIRGSIDTATQPLQNFQLSYGQGLNPTQWFAIGDIQSTFTQGTSLGVWDTSALDGIYTLQLTATFADNSRDTDFVQVTIDNQAPTMSLQAGEPNQIFRYPVDTSIPIVANVSDNLAINRVEFYHNGTLIATDNEWPYGFEFPITVTGIERFTATVFDQVGNTTQSEISVEILRN